MECSQKLPGTARTTTTTDDHAIQHALRSAIQHALRRRMMPLWHDCRCFSMPNGTRINTINWELHQLPLQTGVFSNIGKITSNSTVIAISCGPSSRGRYSCGLSPSSMAITVLLFVSLVRYLETPSCGGMYLSVIIGMQERLHEILPLSCIA